MAERYFGCIICGRLFESESGDEEAAMKDHAVTAHIARRKPLPIWFITDDRERALAKFSGGLVKVEIEVYSHSRLAGEGIPLDAPSLDDPQ